MCVFLCSVFERRGAWHNQRILKTSMTKLWFVSMCQTTSCWWNLMCHPHEGPDFPPRMIPFWAGDQQQLLQIHQWFTKGQSSEFGQKSSDCEKTSGQQVYFHQIPLPGTQLLWYRAFLSAGRFLRSCIMAAGCFLRNGCCLLDKLLKLLGAHSSDYGHDGLLNGCCK